MNNPSPNSQGLRRRMYSGLFNLSPLPSKRDLVGMVFSIVMVAYVLAPRFWEPGRESLKNWVSAQILRQTGEFTVFHHGPLYNLYLQLFLFCDYPWSLQLEHFFSHIFAYVAICLMLRRFLPPIPALLLACAWIPTLWTIEGGARVLGIGLVALYFYNCRRGTADQRYLPIPLLCAGLVDAAFIPLLGGHVLGVAFSRRHNGLPLFITNRPGRRCHPVRMAVLLSLAALFLSALALQSSRPDNNVHAHHYPHVPFPQTDILSVGSLQTGNWKYVVRHFPPAQWPYLDWFFTHAQAYDGAQSIWAAMARKPGVMVHNMISNIPGALNVPLKFVFGKPGGGRRLHAVMIVLAALILATGTVVFIGACKEHGAFHEMGSACIGGGAIIGVLFLVWFSDRYIITLLPLSLIAIAHAGRGLRQGALQLYRRFDCRADVSHGQPETTGHCQMVSTATVLLSIMISLSVVATTLSAQGSRSGLRNLRNNPYLLAGPMQAVHGELMMHLDNKCRVLAYEEPWIRAFTDVALDHIYHALYLPPYRDKSGAVNAFLHSLDAIWVSHTFASKHASHATQVYLRYRLHVAPFLEKAVQNDWIAHDIKGFGKIYRKRSNR